MQYPTRHDWLVNSETMTIAARVAIRSVRPLRPVVLAGLLAVGHVEEVAAGPDHDGSRSPARRTESSLTAESVGTVAVAGPAAGLAAGPAAATSAPNEARGDAAPASVPAVTSLDGRIVWLSPQVAWTQRDAGGDSLVGLELALTWVRERHALALWGLTAGAARYAKGDAGRIWLSLAAASRRPLGVLAGVAAGPVLELSAQAHPRAGLAASVWLFAGVVPFVRMAAVADRGLSAEIGLQIALPIRRW